MRSGSRMNLANTFACAPATNRITELFPTLRSMCVQFLMMRNSPSHSKNGSILSVMTTSRSRNRHAPERPLAGSKSCSFRHASVSGLLGNGCAVSGRISMPRSMPRASSVIHANRIQPNTYVPTSCRRRSALPQLTYFLGNFACGTIAISMLTQSDTIRTKYAYH
jgi:hypothetical protein